MVAISLHDIAHWIGQYGLIVVFLAPLLEIIIFVVPGETALTFAGYMVYQGTLPLLPTIGVGFAGAVCGISLSYGLGRIFGVTLVRRYGTYIHLTESKMARVHAWYGRHGKWTLTVGYYIPGVRHVIALVAGASKLGWPLFALFAYPGALIWAASFVLLGNFLGAAAIHLVERNYGWILIAGAIAAALAVLFYFLWHHEE